eukprot:5205251-Alexandrium_andersonii.AAC.1
MSASLVGSEMCIRDRSWVALSGCGSCPGEETSVAGRSRPVRTGPASNSVSYTHLTLPTICSV